MTDLFIARKSQETQVKSGGSVTGTASNDQDCIDRVLAGEAAAYEGIMRRYNNRLFRLARSVVKNDDAAKDVVQEAYVRAYYRLSQFKGPLGFSSWLCKITFNEALGRLRSNHIDKNSTEYIDNIYGDETLQPESRAMAQDNLRHIESAIDSLPQNFRTVFMLRGVEQLSIAETAELLELKPATVKTRFHRARNLLQEHLSKQLDDITGDAFKFGGVNCDEIVYGVYRRIAGIQLDFAKN